MHEATLLTSIGHQEGIFGQNVPKRIVLCKKSLTATYIDQFFMVGSTEN